jgi:hypothetical protein
MHEFFFENLRNPARNRRAGLMRQFRPGQVYSRTGFYRNPKKKFFFLKKGTKGEKKQIGATDRTPRETLEGRLDKTPSNARCFAQGSSLMC